MKYVFKLILTALVCNLIASLAMAESKPLAERDLVNLLESLRKAVVSQNSKQNAVALRSFTKHAASPVAANTFYLECLKKLRFTDEGKRAEAWRIYREDNDSELNTVFHRQAKQMELKYLVLTIKAVHAKDRRDLMPTLLKYIDELLAMDGRAYDLMESADSSVFTEAYDIESSVDPGDWAMDPTDVAGIYDNAILKHMRKHRDPRLVTGWQRKISDMKKFAVKRQEGEVKAEREEEREERKEQRGRGGRGGRGARTGEFAAEARAEEDRYEEFTTETLPEMKWAMCEDLSENGFRDEALPLMLKVIRDHADYKEVNDWLTSLQTDVQAAMQALRANGTPVEAK